MLFILLAGSIVHAQNLKSGGVLKPEQAIMDIRHYTISLKINIDQQSIDGVAEISLITTAPTALLLFDLVHLLTVKKVWVNGKATAFTQVNDLVHIECQSELMPGKVNVKIAYGGKPGVSENPPWSGGFTWARDSLGNPWVAITCESEGAKIFFPCKDHPSDEPNEGAELIVTVPKDLFVAGPGLLTKTSSKGTWKTYHWKTNYTINNYSILFNIGKYKLASRRYRTAGGHDVPLQFYVLENHQQYAGRLLDVLERSVRHEEKYFGEYPWYAEKIAVCETPHLGMEHQTLNAYGNRFKFTKSGGKDFDWLLLHELGHEWWGNKVTARDWADMWIHEGICAFGDALYTQDNDGKEAYLKRMRSTGMSTQNKRPIVQGENLDSDQVYQSDIYGKGAFFMHTLRYVLGDEKFFPTLKKLATDQQYTLDHLIDTNDIEKLFSKAYGVSLKPLFDLYLRTTSKLEIKVTQFQEGIYELQLTNIEGSLPLEISSDAGSKILMVGQQKIMVASKTLPVIDPEMYYLKRITIE